MDDSEPGRDGGGGPLVSERDGLTARESELTSPSHRFFPFRQLVQARAPRFGMCCWDWELPDGDSAMDIPSSGPPRRRFLLAFSPPFDTDGAAPWDVEGKKSRLTV
jgi:hypothetical protein